MAFNFCILGCVCVCTCEKLIKAYIYSHLHIEIADRWVG
jgi:hypothetical protein